MKTCIRIFLVLVCLIPCVYASDTHPWDKQQKLVKSNPINLKNNSIQFAEFDYKGSPWNHQIKEYGLGLHLSGVLALNQNTVFLFGDFRAPGGPVRSFLIRSSDGGIHWTEVKIPRPISTTTELVFINRSNGWAVDIEYLEGAGPGRLYSTSDSGLNWHLITPILPTPGNGSYLTIGLKLSNEKEITIWSEQENEEFCKFISHDGGKIWSKTKCCCYLDVCDFSWVAPPKAKSLYDRSIWMIKKADKGPYRILRKMHSSSSWQTIIEIPEMIDLKGE